MSKKHQAAMGNPDVVLAMTAPSVPSFLEALRNVRERKGLGAEGSGDFKRKRLVKAKFCLAEALRAKTRLQLQRQCTLTLHSDASKARLLVRAQGCDTSGLEPFHALIGTMPMRHGTDAISIAKAVLTILADLCTPFKGAESLPGFREEVCPTGEWPVDQSLLMHVLNIVEVFNADAAADEQLAGQLLSTPLTAMADAFQEFEESPLTTAILQVSLDGLAQAFPNIKVLNKDKPHAARRIVSRTWKCDPKLKSLVSDIFMKSESIVQQLQWSDNLRMKYSQNVRALQYNPLWREQSDKFSAAKHRFDTWSMPFAKVVLTLEAVVATAQAAHDERPNEKTGQAAKTFLNLLSEETVLLLGMLADAGEENLQLTRFLDSEHMATPALAKQVAEFVRKLDVLFGRGAVLETGYTSVALQFLEKPRTIYINRQAKTLGGVPRVQLATIACDCLKRFASWTRLAKEVVAAEFPQFELLQAMACFELTPMADRRLAMTAGDERLALDEKLEKLAAVLQLDEDRLRQQFYDFHAAAQHRFDELGISSFAAWRASVLATSANKRMNQMHASETLSQALARAAGWGASTSGVEQMFSGVRELCSKQPRAASAR